MGFDTGCGRVGLFEVDLHNLRHKEALEGSLTSLKWCQAVRILDGGGCCVLVQLLGDLETVLQKLEAHLATKERRWEEAGEVCR
jgi:hypothetical protein